MRFGVAGLYGCDLGRQYCTEIMGSPYYNGYVKYIHGGDPLHRYMVPGCGEGGDYIGKILSRNYKGTQL